ncbi:hypothetical protein DFH09DRAFT_1270258 [Mycena vulgaris]|nr:hypothetical protein DFH09DRAFT_1270258 [Mycena vulgaris]
MHVAQRRSGVFPRRRRWAGVSAHQLKLAAADRSAWNDGGGRLWEGREIPAGETRIVPRAKGEDERWGTGRMRALGILLSPPTSKASEEKVGTGTMTTRIHESPRVRESESLLGVNEDLGALDHGIDERRAVRLLEGNGVHGGFNDRSVEMSSWLWICSIRVVGQVCGSISVGKRTKMKEEGAPERQEISRMYGMGGGKHRRMRLIIQRDISTKENEQEQERKNSRQQFHHAIHKRTALRISAFTVIFVAASGPAAASSRRAAVRSDAGHARETETGTELAAVDGAWYQESRAEGSSRCASHWAASSAAARWAWVWLRWDARRCRDARVVLRGSASARKECRGNTPGEHEERNHISRRSDADGVARRDGRRKWVLDGGEPMAARKA